MKKKTDSQLLLDAADHLNKVGHVKGDLSDEQGRVCLRGAIHYAIHGNAQWPGPESQLRLANRLVGKVSVALGHRNAIQWNNEPSTTKAQAVDALRKAAEACE